MACGFDQLVITTKLSCAPSGPVPSKRGMARKRLPASAPATIAAVCVIGKSVPAGRSFVVVLGLGVMHLARAADAAQRGVALELLRHGPVGGLPHVEADAQPVLALPGRVVGDHLDVLAVTVGQRHVEALARGPGIAGILHLVAHRAGRGDDVPGRGAVERQLVDGPVGGELARDRMQRVRRRGRLQHDRGRGRHRGQRDHGSARGQEGGSQGRQEAHAAGLRRVGEEGHRAASPAAPACRKQGQAVALPTWRRRSRNASTSIEMPNTSA